MDNLKQVLEKEVENRNCKDELCFEKPDPLYVAKKYNDEYIALICALFGYGNAHSILKFLESLDFSLMEQNEKIISKELQGFYYRFQTNDDVINFFIALKRLKHKDLLQNIFLQGYCKENSVLEGIDKIIHSVSEELENFSEGLRFLVGTPMKRDRNYKIKLAGNGAYKRYNMFLRWMVRCDNLDIGLWKNVDKKDLVIPLDTHTFKVSRKLGLLTRKTYDLKAAVELTNKLKEFDPSDPVKYDFALYRLGQEKII